jgi:hypothetical protein
LKRCADPTCDGRKLASQELAHKPTRSSLSVRASWRHRFPRRFLTFLAEGLPASRAIPLSTILMRACSALLWPSRIFLIFFF